MRLDATSSDDVVTIPVSTDSDPTGNDVAIAIVDHYRAPESGDWLEAEWVAGLTYAATVNVAPSSYGAGDYATWVRLTTALGETERRAGILLIR